MLETLSFTHWHLKLGYLELIHMTMNPRQYLQCFLYVLNSRVLLSDSVIQTGTELDFDFRSQLLKLKLTQQQQVYWKRLLTLIQQTRFEELFHSYAFSESGAICYLEVRWWYKVCLQCSMLWRRGRNLPHLRIPSQKGLKMMVVPKRRNQTRLRKW